jgi:hypothetical protein
MKFGLLYEIEKTQPWGAAWRGRYREGIVTITGLAV